VSMPNIPTPASRNSRPARDFLWVSCACALLCGGCFTAKRPAPTLGAVVLSHPVVPPGETAALADAPEIYVEDARRVSPLVIPHGAPAKPRVAAPPVREAEVAEKPQEPIIAPEFSDEQIASAKTAAQQSLSVAEQNLNLSKGKQLNEAQQDLVSKIQGFVDSAREAMKNNDWLRARNQAKKAEVLSQEFAGQP
jgi:hypothetical protein